MLALDLHDSQVHHGGCGFHESLATNTNNYFRSRISFCPLCAAVEQERRDLEAQDKKARKGKGDDDTGPRPSDGRRVHTRMLSPLEVEDIRLAARTAPAAHTARARALRHTTS